MSSADIRKYIKLLEAAGSKAKIDRSAFLYLEPKEGQDPNNFAQCATCFMYLPNKKRCSIFPKNFVVQPDASCGLYVSGKASDFQPWHTSVTPKAAGYVEEQVRCENCSWYVKGRCDLYRQLTEEMGDIFRLDDRVNAKGCCNAWQK